MLCSRCISLEFYASYFLHISDVVCHTYSGCTNRSGRERKPSTDDLLRCFDSSRWQECRKIDPYNWIGHWDITEKIAARGDLEQLTKRHWHERNPEIPAILFSEEQNPGSFPMFLLKPTLNLAPPAPRSLRRAQRIRAKPNPEPRHLSSTVHLPTRPHHHSTRICQRQSPLDILRLIELESRFAQDVVKVEVRPSPPGSPTAPSPSPTASPPSSASATSPPTPPGTPWTTSSPGPSGSADLPPPETRASPGASTEVVQITKPSPAVTSGCYITHLEAPSRRRLEGRH